MMPSVPVDLLLLPLAPSVTPFHGRSCSHRLKQCLEKSDRRDYGRSECAELISGAEESLKGFQSSLNKKHLPDLVHEGLATEIGHALRDPSHIPGAREFNCASDGNDTSDSEESTVSGESISKRVDSAAKSMSPTSHASDKRKSPLTSPAEVDGINEDFGTVLNEVFSEESNTLPLRSAMKGSREKSGASPKKLTVKWDPDVYDPIPTIVSHTVVRGKKQQRSRKEKRNGKDKKKGGSNSSRGTNGKDKKQYRKTAGSPSKCYKPLDACDRVLNDFRDFDNDGFDVHSPESYCGSSFLKKSPNTVHFSLGEAS